MNRALERLPTMQMLIIAGSVTCLLITGVLSVLLSSPGQTSALMAENSNPERVLSSSARQTVDIGDDQAYYQIPRGFRSPSPSAPGWQLSSYTVQPGDSLWKIAVKIGTDLSILLTLNPALVADNLTPGIDIQIVRRFQGVVHRVKPGDELAQVSAAFGLASEMVAKANGLSGSDPLEEGALLFLPGARPRVMLAARGEVVRRPPPVQITPTTSGWVWPITGGRYFSEFGWREDSFHRGLDIAVPTGTQAVAVHSGIVTMAGWNGGYGYSVMIDHGDGIESLYGHASAVLVSLGQSINAGEPVILVGSTGNSTGPHLHLEVMTHGTPVNPRDFLP